MKTKIIITFAILFSALQSKAQFALDDCNPIIEALEDVVHIVRQDYALKDENGDLFGQGGNNFFGYAIGPAVAINGKVYYGKYTHKPYLTDNSHEGYGDGFKPFSTNVYVKGLQDKKMQAVDKKVEGTAYAYFPATDSVFMEHKPEMAIGNEMKCVVVTFLTDTPNNLENAKYDMSYVNNTVTWNGTVGLLAENRLGDKTVFGLLFYENTGKGRVNYELGGFVDKVEDQWVVSRFQELEPIKSSGKLKKIKGDSTKTGQAEHSDKKEKDEKEDNRSIWPWKK
ncbi:MAG: hypothetical protein ACQESX_07250 [Bacteroidota bacterium]